MNLEVSMLLEESKNQAPAVRAKRLKVYFQNQRDELLAQEAAAVKQVFKSDEPSTNKHFIAIADINRLFDLVQEIGTYAGVKRILVEEKGKEWWDTCSRWNLTYMQVETIYQRHPLYTELNLLAGICSSREWRLTSLLRALTDRKTEMERIIQLEKRAAELEALATAADEQTKEMEQRLADTAKRVAELEATVASHGSDIKELKAPKTWQMRADEMKEQGYTGKAIAEALGKAPETVSRYFNRKKKK